MEQSLFIQYVDKWFGPIITKFVELINGKKDEPTYLHMSMLKKEYSPTLKWGSLSSDGRIIAADVVAMDTSLPLKKRDSISKAEGDIPKMGMKLYLNERTMTDLDILQSSSGDREKEIIAKLFTDTKKCYMGIKEQLEYMFLQALSTGVTLIEDDKNVGVGIRIDFFHPDSNKFGVQSAWANTDATPITDIENVMENAREAGHTLLYLLMDRKAFNQFRKADEVKELFAAHMGFNGANIPTPTFKQANEVMLDNYGFTIQVIDRSVQFERDGVRTSSRPWGDNKTVFLTSLDVGTLTYGTLAEENHPVEGVKYQKAEGFILLSKYHKNDPIREFTSSQALVVPVINNVDEMYIMDVADAAVEVQTEGNTGFLYEGSLYLVTSVITAINLADEDQEANAEHTDVELQSMINSLSDEQVETFEANITLGGV